MQLPLTKTLSLLTIKRASTVLKARRSPSSPTTLDLLIMVRELHTAAASFSPLGHLTASDCRLRNWPATTGSIPCRSDCKTAPAAVRVGF